MTAEFITVLDVYFKEDGVWILREPFCFHSEVLGETIIVPRGFETDFASVPRLPLAYALFGGVSQEAAVIHDYLYRRRPDIDRSHADAVFLEAMKAQGKNAFIRYGMWLGVRLFGWQFHHPEEETKGALK